MRGAFPIICVFLLAACARPSAQLSSNLGTLPNKSNLVGPIKARTNGPVYAMQIGPDGSMYLGGFFTTINPVFAPNFFSTDLSGNPDYTFNFGSGFNGQVNAVAALSNGSIIVAGNFSRFQGQLANNIAKLTPAGTLDTTFSPAAGSNGTDSIVYSVAVDGADNIYLGGCFYTYRGVVVSHITKLSSAGVRDTTFSPNAGNTGANSCVNSVAYYNNNVYFGGQFTSYRGATANYLAEVDSTGVLNTTFTAATGPNGPVSAVAVSSTGPSIYFGGSFATYRGATAQNLGQADANGALNTTFTAATGTNNPVLAITVDTSGIYVGGDFTTYRGAPANSLAKVNSNGVLDTTFNPGAGPNGFANGINTSYVNSITVVGSNVYAGGTFVTYQGMPANNIAELSTTGALNAGFNPPNSGNGFNSSVSAVFSANNLLYYGGLFNSYRGTLVNNIAKIDASGNVDNAFLPLSGAVGTNGVVESIAVSGIDLYIGGSFGTYQGALANNIAKVSAVTGVLDTTFNPAGAPNGANQVVSALLAGANGIYLGGNFNGYRGTFTSGIAYVASNGVLISTFSPGVGFNGAVNAFALSGSSLYVGGGFTTYQTSPANYIAKLDAVKGSLDTTFNPASGGKGFDQVVYALAVGGSNLFAGGYFSNYQGAPANHIAELNATTGALNTTFNPPTGANGLDGFVTALTATGSSVYAGGSFQNYRGWPANSIVKADFNGNVDQVFSPFPTANGVDQIIYSLLGVDNWIFVGGAQTLFEAQPSLYITTLNSSGVIQQ